ncbi:MAG: PilN domain-containing protein [Acidobacteriota bacterium]
MIRINLIAEARAQKVRKPLISFDSGNETMANVVMAAVIVLAIFFCGYKYFALNSTLGDLGNKIANANIERERLKDILKKGEEFKAQRELLKRKVDLITQLKKNQSVPVHLLDQVSRNLPEFLWLENMNQQGGAVSLSGKATNYNAVSNLYNNLRDSNSFVDVVLGTTQVAGSGVSFSMTCKFVNPHEPDDGKTTGDSTAVASASTPVSQGGRS